MLLAVVFCSFLSVSANAQQKKYTPEQKATKMTDKMKSDVSLTDNQYKQVYAVNLKYAEKMQALRSKDGGRENNKEEFKSLRKEQKNELSSILTDEQREKYKSVRHDRKKGHGKKKDVLKK